ncbi:MAG: tetratricopeptide repeat protein [Bacteroidetes bacterium]|nr:tetratricopeptide repeat protein [Bacteroidota bacterium]HET6244179.1 tetratricopeptide repeat protein [Bacteroidia bacterium]
MKIQLAKIFLFVLVLLHSFVNAQIETSPDNEAPQPTGSDEQLAAHFFQNKEYDKAVIYYEKLFEKSRLDFYYGYYLDCLIELKEYKKAEKIIKKQLKQNPLKLGYQVDLGYVLQSSGENAKAKKEFDHALSQLSPSQGQIFEVANAFIKRKELDYALLTYEKGRKLLKNSYPFSFEIAEIYFQKGNLEGMINEYLDVLLINDAYIQQVQNYLQRIYDTDMQGGSKGSELVKNQLLIRIQKYPDKITYAEMLIWLFIQEKNFSAALIQTKAIDKRLKEEGGRLITLAKTCVSNHDYKTAISAYQAVIEKGPENYYYIISKIELLEVLNKKIIEQVDYTREDIITLEKSYLSTLQELGKSASTAPLLKGLGHLYAFYLFDIENAIALLEESLKIPGVSNTFMAEVKLLLADILLMSGDIWEASLYYSQVEKSFKHDPIGDEAKLRNAKISYYTGDFAWSQAQLDVLKGSTSKLIANDAMRLSLLITDNSTVDTTLLPLEMYANAELLSFQNKDDEAILILDSIHTLFPGHALADEIVFKKASILIKKQDYQGASKQLLKIVKTYSYDILADDALFKLAEIHHFKFKDLEKAKEYYHKLMLDYPGSTLTVEARKRYRELRGDKLN